MPSEYDIAVNLLISWTFLIVQKERNKNLFDGWPTIVFFWPDMSYGTLEVEL
jgi:hypothetical protein